jgi:hypothetical protein
MLYALLAEVFVRVARTSMNTRNFLQAMGVVSTSLQFLTVMLLTTYISHELTKWYSQEAALLSIQGRLNGLVMYLSAAMRNDHQKRLAFRFYRYLNLFHALLYRGINDSCDFDIKDLRHCGLVVGEKEAAAIIKSGPKARDSVMAWLVCLFHKSAHAVQVGSMNI